MAADGQDVVFVALVERDLAGDSMMTWCFPEVPDTLQDWLLLEVGAAARAPQPAPALTWARARRAASGSGQRRARAPPRRHVDVHVRGSRRARRRRSLTWIARSAATSSGLPGTTLSSIQAFQVVVASTAYAPLRFSALAQLMRAAYGSTGEPTSMLEIMLSVTATAGYSGAHGAWKASSGMMPRLSGRTQKISGSSAFSAMGKTPDA